MRVETATHKHWRVGRAGSKSVEPWKTSSPASPRELSLSLESSSSRTSSAPAGDEIICISGPFSVSECVRAWNCEQSGADRLTRTPVPI